jgi:hypothetical protein
VTVEIPYATVLFVVGEAAFIAVGALIGIGVALVRMRGERRGN